MKRYIAFIVFITLTLVLMFCEGYEMAEIHLGVHDVDFGTLSTVLCTLMGISLILWLRWSFYYEEPDYPNNPPVMCKDRDHDWDYSRQRFYAETGRMYVWCAKCGKRKPH